MESLINVIFIEKTTPMERKLLFVISLFCSATFFAQTFNGTGGNILDNQTLQVTIPVSGLPNSINTTSFGLESICLDITHTYDGDIAIKLVAPDGTIVSLANNQGGGNDNFTNTCFRQDASQSIFSGTPPYTGTFKPEDELGLVNNFQNPNGIWTLTINDGFGGDTGNLNSWSLFFGNNPATSSVFTSSNLPIVKINTVGNQSIPDEPKISAQLQIIDNGYGNINLLSDFPNVYNNQIGIEQRGSSSSGFPQKSYGFETRDQNGTVHDTILMAMPQEHDWILYAPYDDKTCMRNILIYDLSNKLGHYASRTKMCEVFVNSSYQGIYVMMEKIKRDGDRVNISKLLNTDITGDELTGGYIVKIDKFTGSTNDSWSSSYGSTTGSTINYLYHYPSATSIVPQQKTYIQNYINDFETALNGPNSGDPLLGYRNYTIPETFIDYFILNEFSRNVDGYRLSTYLHKEKDSKGGKLRMGPVWDYNLALWNADYCDGDQTTGWAYQFGNVCGGDNWQIPTWWNKFLSDPWFDDELKCRWTALRQTSLSQDSLFYSIDSIAAYIDQAKDRHFNKWPILGVYTWPNPSPIPSDYAGEITAMKTWIVDRLQWLDANMPGTCHLGLSEESISSIQTYPNPFNSSISISLFSTENSDAIVRIVNTSGAEVLTARNTQLSYGDNTIELATEELSKGIYFIQIQTDKGMVSSKVVKN